MRTTHVIAGRCVSQYTLRAMPSGSFRRTYVHGMYVYGMYVYGMYVYVARDAIPLLETHLIR